MSRIDLGSKPLSYPQPVLIIAAYDKEGNIQCMNAAWGGISKSTEISMCLSANHATVKAILETGAFTVSMGDAAHAAACDYVGMASGNDVADKFARSGFTATRSEKVNAPIINELAVCLECTFVEYKAERDTHQMIGEIVNVSIDESVMTDGKVDIKKVQPITFDPFTHSYHVIGEKIGDAWGIGKALI